MPPQQIWFITGISRGFGRALAIELLDRGRTVVGTTRDGRSDLDAGGGTLHVVELDVTSRGQAAVAIERAVELAGHIDVVVNNAGYGLLGAVEETTEEAARHLFEVNFFGALHVTQAVLPILRAQGSGHLVNLSSVAGRDPGSRRGALRSLEVRARRPLRGPRGRARAARHPRHDRRAGRLPHRLPRTDLDPHVDASDPGLPGDERREPRSSRRAQRQADGRPRQGRARDHRCGRRPAPAAAPRARRGLARPQPRQRRAARRGHGPLGARLAGDRVRIPLRSQPVRRGIR